MKKILLTIVMAAAVLLTVITAQGCKSDKAADTAASGPELLQQYIDFITASTGEIRKCSDPDRLQAITESMTAEARPMIESFRKSDYRPTDEEWRRLATAITDMTIAVEDVIYGDLITAGAIDGSAAGSVADCNSRRAESIDHYTAQMKSCGSLSALAGSLEAQSGK